MLTTFDGCQVVRWCGAELRFARRHGWTGRVFSGQRSRARQLAAAIGYAARHGLTLRQAYPSGVYASNHVGTSWPKGAVDVTDPEGLARALRVAHSRPRGRRLRWALDAGLDDPPHFSASGR